MFREINLYQDTVNLITEKLSEAFQANKTKNFKNSI